MPRDGILWPKFMRVRTSIEQGYITVTKAILHRAVWVLIIADLVCLNLVFIIYVCTQGSCESWGVGELALVRDPWLDNEYQQREGS